MREALVVIHKMVGIVVILSCGHWQIILLTKRCGKRNTSRSRITRMHQSQPKGNKKNELGKQETYSDWSESYKDKSESGQRKFEGCLWQYKPQSRKKLILWTA